MIQRRILRFYINTFILFLSDACSIQLEDIVILTGGFYTKNTVSVYSTDGWLEDLPDLLTGRYVHGCGHYINNNNKMVTSVTLLDDYIDVTNKPISGLSSDRG